MSPRGSRIIFSEGVRSAGIPSRGLRAAALCWIVLAFTFPILAKTPSREVGFVSEISGDWVTILGDPSWIVGLHSPVFAGQRIQARGPLAKQSITIVLASGSTKALRCAEDADRCKTPIIMDEEPATRSAYERIATAVMKLVLRDEPEPFMAVTRDIDGLQSAVLPSTGDQLDLRPALKRVPEGEYLAELTPEKSTNADMAPARFPVTVASSGPVVAKRGPLKRGLYRLTMTNNSSKKAVGSSVLVLLAGPEDFESLRAAFAQAREMTASWDEEVDAGSIQYFMAKYLRVLANDLSGAR